MNTELKHSAGEKLIRILAFTLVISVMNASIFNIVLPEIARDFQLSTAQVSWVTSIYMLMYAIGSVIYGKLADKYKFKNLLTFGLIVFALGSAIGLTANSYIMILLGRLFQAAGSSVIPAAAMIIPVRYFRPEVRGRALGISAIGMAMGNAAAPVVSGVVMSVGDWRWLFSLSLLTLLTLPFYRKYLDDQGGVVKKMDLLGGGLLAGMVALLLLAITNGGWMFGIGGLILLLLFILRIVSVPEPFVEPRLFRNKNYVFGLLMVVLVNGCAISLPFLIPQLFSRVNHVDPGIIGFLMVPGAAASAILGLKGGRLADQRGNSFVIYVAFGLLILCYMLLSFTAGSLPWLIGAIIIFGNVGVTFMQIGLSNTISRTLPPEQTGVGMGLMSMLNFITFAAVSAILSRILDQGAAGSWNPLHPYPGAAVFSNIYLSAAGVSLILTVIYTLRNKQARGMVKVTEEKQLTGHGLAD
ncbi:MFS transporter [Paenibacillus tuaregi]|uniref:MFS transporter n=1 Tax=Paenibacillus tuaregi TaxID=1816681 RepID=UPI000837CE13|nr:MFS transporter [Paenibacillus tuaregi]